MGARGRVRLFAGAWLAACLVARGAAGAEPPAAPSEPIRLATAVALALEHYPAVRAAEGQAAAARAGVGLARTAYLPRTDLLLQENRATRNNVAGLLLPQAVVPSISGPVPPAVSYEGVWGSAAGLLVSWEPFDFGLRRANVTAAEDQVRQAGAAVEVTRLDVAVNAANAFLAASAAEQTVRAARANVERLQVLERSVAALVANELRPGADLSRADADLASARIRLIESERAAAVARATLAETIGLGGTPVSIDAAALFDRVPAVDEAPARVESHPIAQAQQAAVAAARSREEALARSYFPHVTVQSALFTRGAVAPGTTPSGSDGLWPDTPNWAAGVSVTFPVFDIFGTRARREVEAGAEAAERARYDQAVQGLRAREARARADLDAARQIVQNTPVELKAAQEAEGRARARYQAGLATLTEVADAQRLLAQAQIDDGVARLGVWQAMVAEMNARGDLAQLLQVVKGP